MSNTKISVEAYGNPSANDGYVPLVLANKPSFQMDEPKYPGLNDNSWFIVVRIDKDEVVYRLHKNRTYSSGASRQGDLDIAFALPKGWKLDNGYTPFDVLMDLMRTFLGKCMICREKDGEHYEFKKDSVPDDVLDEVIDRYSLKQEGSPWHVMDPSGPLGFLQLDEERMGDFLKDVQYAELERFREVIVAEKVTASGYKEIRGLQIPRIPSYSIYLDGTYKGGTSDISEQISIHPDGHAESYEEPATFTIGHLRDGDFYEGVRFDAAQERVDVDSRDYFKLKRKTVRIAFSADVNQLKKLLKDGKLTLWYGQEQLPIDTTNEAFTLMGEQLNCNLSQLRLQCATNEYVFENPTYDNKSKQLRWRVSKSKKTSIAIKDNNDLQRGEINGKPKPGPDITEDLRVVLFILSFDDDLMKIMSEVSSSAIKIFKLGDERNFYTRKVIAAPSCTPAGKEVQVLIPVACPKKKASYEVELSVGGVIYKNTIKLKDNDLKVQTHFQGKQESHPVTRSAFTRSTLFFIAGFLLCALLTGIGFGTKYAYDKYHNPKDTTATGQDSTAHDSAFTDSTISLGAVDQKTHLRAIRVRIIERSKTLSKQGLTFDEVEDMYQEMRTDRKNWEEAGKNFCSKLEVYHKVVTLIKNGDYERICAEMNHDKFPGLSNFYRNRVGYISMWDKNSYVRSHAKEYFENHYKDFCSFADLEKISDYCKAYVFQCSDRSNGATVAVKGDVER